MKLRFKTSLRRRIAGLLLAFVVLVGFSVAVISWTKAVQQQDAMLINLAGRQRMLVEEMEDEALHYNRHWDDAPMHIAELQEAADTFELTFHALIDGGQAFDAQDDPVDVPATQSPDILARLHQVHHTWDSFRGYLDVVVAAEPGSPEFTAAIQSLQRLAPKLVQESGEVTRLYEAAALQSAARLRWMQVVIFASALGLLAIGYLATQKYVLKPLHVLSSVAERFGRGDWDTPIQVTGPREIEAMAHSLDTLRTQLKTSQADLTKRAERLELSVTRRTRELETAYAFSQDIVAQPELEQLLSSITDRARDLTGAEASILCLLDGEGGYLFPAGTSGEVAVQPSSQQATGPGRVAQVVGGGQTVPIEVSCADCRFLNGHKPGHCVATPLRAGEQTLGALCVSRSGQQRFDSDETRALTLLANSAAIAIANASLLHSAQRYSEQMATLAERERVAAELHDNLAQTLSFLNLKADRLQELLATGHSVEAGTELGCMQAALNGAYDQVRSALVGLSQPADITLDLAQELADYLAEFQGSSGLSADLTIADPAALELPPVARVQVLHIVREALTNARRHARAGQVWVRVDRILDANTARFTVEDDGRGFDPANVGGDNHLGLSIMQARAQRRGGQLTIDSTPGAGTKVVALFPLDTIGISPDRIAVLTSQNDEHTRFRVHAHPKES
jgi:two-component system nitrate/nitrite sensor histidine kinase NarX